jgi:ubiquinone/menaquinone biosynthesis C-methylase UbiE
MVESGSDTGDSYDRWARYYDPFISVFRLREVRRQTVEICGVRPGDRVLDVCTGTGDVALEFARRCDDVTGIDLSEGMLAVAREKDRQGKIRFLQMDATAMDFSDDAFDVSSVSFGLHDMPPDVREQVLREMARVTRGKVVITEYRSPPNPLLRALYIAVGSLYESQYFPGFVRSDFEGLLARCGLEVVEQRHVHAGLLRICLASPFSDPKGADCSNPFENL